MKTEVIYLGHDNTVDLLLKSGGAAKDLSGVTKITAAFGDTLIQSTDPANGLITWAQEGYDTGEIRLDLGGQSIPPGIYSVPVVIYDTSNPDGIVWGLAPIRIQPEVEELQSFLSIYDLKLELGIELNNTEQDARLALTVRMVQDLWEELTNRKWAGQDYIEIHSNLDGHATKLFLENYPVSEIESIKVDYERKWGSDIQVVSSDHYSLDPETGIIYLDIALPKGRRNIQVKYTAGYDPDELPASIKQVMIRQACHWYRQAKSASYNTTSLSQPDGGSVSHALNLLKDGLLPEFTSAAAHHGRLPI